MKQEVTVSSTVVLLDIVDGLVIGLLYVHCRKAHFLILPSYQLACLASVVIGVFIAPMCSLSQRSHGMAGGMWSYEGVWISVLAAIGVGVMSS